jgi:hypothetical protein
MKIKRFLGFAVALTLLVSVTAYARTSNYPNGFPNGVVIRGVPVLNTYGGNIFWVDSVAGSNGYPGDRPSRAFGTIDYAIGRCTDNNGDVIVVMPNHAETVTADSGVDVDVAGAAIVGLGSGEDRPTVTFTTATTADFKMAAANTSVYGLVFKCNIDTQDMMIEVTGDDVTISNCEFREGTGTTKTFITVGVADGDADRCRIENSRFYMPTASNGDAAISLEKDHAGVEILDNFIYGDFDLAGIDVPANGNAQTNLLIARNYIVNTLNSQHAIQINSTGSTGQINDNRLVTDAVGTSLDPGGLGCSGNLWNIEGDSDFAGVGPLPAADTATNFIGVDDNNNAAATTSVAANRDGTLLERSESEIAGIYDAVSEPPTAKSLQDTLHKDGSYTYDNTTDSLEAIADKVSVVDGYWDVPSADVTFNSQVREVVGNKSDAAAAGAVSTTESLMAYAKQNVTEGIATTAAIGVIDGYWDVPAADVTFNSQVREVVGNKSDAAAAGAVTTTESLMAYAKQNVGANINIAEAAEPTYNHPNYIALSVDLTSATWNTQAAHEILTVTGAVRVKILVECTETLTDAGDAATLALGTANNTAAWITSTSAAGAGDANQLDAGEAWIDATPADDYTGTTATFILDFTVLAGDDVGYTIGGSAITDGTLIFHMWWTPLDSTGAAVVGAGGAL